MDADANSDRRSTAETVGSGSPTKRELNTEMPRDASVYDDDFGQANKPTEVATAAAVLQDDYVPALLPSTP
ncbi:hypothetical protein ABTM52_20700, partial [Acinetobacter baumannii]